MLQGMLGYSYRPENEKKGVDQLPLLWKKREARYIACPFYAKSLYSVHRSPSKRPLPCCQLSFMSKPTAIPPYVFAIACMRPNHFFSPYHGGARYLTYALR